MDVVHGPLKRGETVSKQATNELVDTTIKERDARLELGLLVLAEHTLPVASREALGAIETAHSTLDGLATARWVHEGVFQTVIGLAGAGSVTARVAWRRQMNGRGVSDIRNRGASSWARLVPLGLVVVSSVDTHIRVLIQTTHDLVNIVHGWLREHIASRLFIVRDGSVCVRLVILHRRGGSSKTRRSKASSFWRRRRRGLGISRSGEALSNG
jgi:hypothetical protein